MKRFGIVGMGLFGMAVMSGFLEGEPAAAAPAAAVEAEAAKPTVDLGKEAPAPVLPAEKPGDVDVLDKAGYAPAENDPGLNYAMNFLAKNGFNSDNPAVEAAFGGDFSLLKAELAQKGLPGWEQALGLAEQSYDRHVKENDAKADAVGKVALEIAENMGVDWEQAVAHVGATATPAEKTAINSLLSDPATAHIAARFIAGSFIEGGDTEIEPAARAVGAEVKAHQGAAQGALSRAAYTAELGKLRKTLGDDYISSPQAAALYSRLAK